MLTTGVDPDKKVNPLSGVAMTTEKFGIQTLETAEILGFGGGEDFATLVPKLKARLSGMRLGETCSRCLGSGHFSRNSSGSTVCYKCNGARVTYPGTLKGWKSTITMAKEAVERGELESYFKLLHGRRVSKTATDRAMKAWLDLGLNYNWLEAAEARKIVEAGGELSQEQSLNLAISEVNSKASDIYQGISDLVYGSPKDPRSEEERLRALPSALAEALEKFEELKLLK
jgi:hypothetical protein